MLTGKQLGLKDFSPKSQDAVALQQIAERGVTYDWSWWYPSGNRLVAAISGSICRALVMVSSSIRLTAWLQNLKKKRAGTVREIDVWAESPRLSPLWLSASSSACHGLGDHYRDNAITYKAQRDKMPENWSWWTRQLLTCRGQRDAAALDAKYTKELADAKAGNDALRDDVAAGRRCCTSSSLSVSAREATTASGVDNASPDWQHFHRWTGLFHLRERLITVQKQLEGTQKYINEQQIELPTMATHAIIVSNTHALPAEYKCFKVIKLSNPFTNVCWVSVLTTLSAPPQILAASTVFFCPIPETKKW